jgi:sulfite reductase (NADPH) flavoprotein alpha-component
MCDDDEYSSLMSVNMEAFMELEGRLHAEDESCCGDAPLSAPVRPRHDDCCNRACHDCVWIVYSNECRRFAAHQTGANDTEESRALAHARDLLPAAPLAVQASSDLTPDGSVRYLEVSVPHYKTGDTLIVESPNGPAIVDRCAARLLPESDPANAAARMEALRWRLELCLPPPRALFEELLLHCEPTPAGAAQREELKRLLVRGHYADEYRDLSTVAALSRADSFNDVACALEAYDACRLPLVALARSLRERQPRHYTICTSDVEAPTVAGIAFRIDGSCTDHLAARAPGGHVRAAVRPSNFRLPSAASGERGGGALLMVGAGTGVAPFRAFVREARALKEQHRREHPDDPPPDRTMLLFAGCGTPRDLPFGDELEAAARRGDLELSLAVSRPRGGPDGGVYVQHKLAEDAPRIWSLLQATDTHLFVCGGTAMGRGVHAALLAMARDLGGLSEGGACDFFNDLKGAGRYVAELWGGEWGGGG